MRAALETVKLHVDNLPISDGDLTHKVVRVGGRTYMMTAVRDRAGAGWGEDYLSGRVESVASALRHSALKGRQEFTKFMDEYMT